jgi:hypothetical protein
VLSEEILAIFEKFGGFQFVSHELSSCFFRPQNSRFQEYDARHESCIRLS